MLNIYINYLLFWFFFLNHLLTLIHFDNYIFLKSAMTLLNQFGGLYVFILVIV